MSDDEDYEDEESNEDNVSTSGQNPSNDPAGMISYFPMIFSFPKNLGGSSAGPVMAIANSYSTGKGGVASSVATAYGGYPKVRFFSFST